MRGRSWIHLSDMCSLPPSGDRQGDVEQHAWYVDTQPRGSVRGGRPTGRGTERPLILTDVVSIPVGSHYRAARSWLWPTSRQSGSAYSVSVFKICRWYRLSIRILSLCLSSTTTHFLCALYLSPLLNSRIQHPGLFLRHREYSLNQHDMPAAASLHASPRTW
jgi:hypothetical protein